MKKLLKSLSFGLLLTILFSIIPFDAQCKSLEKDIFRLHILANSDNECDQELKLKVRDKVLSYTNTLYENCNSKEDTINVTRDNLVNIINVAQNEVYNNGYNYDVKGTITNMYFNTRQYGEFTVPSGFYDALRITIGKAEGHNWWCVMYPSFCLGESSDLEKSNLSDSEKNLITDDSEYKVKFQIVEWFEKVKSFLK